MHVWPVVITLTAGRCEPERGRYLRKSLITVLHSQLPPFPSGVILTRRFGPHCAAEQILSLGYHDGRLERRYLGYEFTWRNTDIKGNSGPRLSVYDRDINRNSRFASNKLTSTGIQIAQRNSRASFPIKHPENAPYFGGAWVDGLFPSGRQRCPCNHGLPPMADSCTWIPTHLGILCRLWYTRWSEATVSQSLQSMSTRNPVILSESGGFLGYHLWTPCR